MDSPRAGGKFYLTRSAEKALGGLTAGERAKLTTWLVNQRLQGVEAPRLDAEIVQWASTLPPTSVADRVDRLLLWLSQATDHVGERLRIAQSSRDLEAYAWSESTNSKEIWFLLDTLQQNGWIEARVDSAGFDAKIVIGGYERIADLAKRHVASDQGFVAMWFDSEMNDVFERGMAPGIGDAGYKPMRIDRKAHNNKIDDEIIAEIRRSRFLVADFTQGPDGARGGVYYEAGFAHGLDIPVIFTVREDLIGKTHFDTRQYAHILWKSAADLRKQLADRISATIGDGPHKARN